MPSFNIPLRSIVLVLFIISLSLSFTPFTPPALAQSAKTLPVSETSSASYDCLHMVSLRVREKPGNLLRFRQQMNLQNPMVAKSSNRLFLKKNPIEHRESRKTFVGGFSAHCRGKLILLILKRWVETHVEWDTGRWAMPVYVEFDRTDRWQRVTLLCLHVSRSTP